MTSGPLVFTCTLVMTDSGLVASDQGAGVIGIIAAAAERAFDATVVPRGDTDSSVDAHSVVVTMVDEAGTRSAEDLIFDAMSALRQVCDRESWTLVDVAVQTLDRFQAARAREREQSVVPAEFVALDIVAERMGTTVRMFETFRDLPEFPERFMRRADVEKFLRGAPGRTVTGPAPIGRTELRPADE